MSDAARAVLCICLLAGAACTARNAGTSPRETAKMPSTEHPGTIRMVTMLTGEVREVPASSVPEQRRFVYFRDGTEVATREEATEIVPVVETRMLSLDDRGNLVPSQDATKVRIEEFGPEGRPLRWTVMTK